MAGAVSNEITAFAGRIDVATNKIAAKLSSLAQQLADAGTLAEVQTILSPVVTALEAVAADPVNPLPPETTIPV